MMHSTSSKHQGVNNRPDLKKRKSKTERPKEGKREQ